MKTNQMMLHQRKSIFNNKNKILSVFLLVNTKLAEKEKLE